MHLQDLHTVHNPKVVVEPGRAREAPWSVFNAWRRLATLLKGAAVKHKILVA
jgi:hypothetical protein